MASSKFKEGEAKKIAQKRLSCLHDQPKEGKYTNHGGTNEIFLATQHVLHAFTKVSGVLARLREANFSQKDLDRTLFFT